MANLNFQALSSELLVSQARWQASDNVISRLPETKRKTLLGVQFPAGYQPPQPSAAAAAPVATFAPAVDWRNRNGNHVTAVKDQGGCGSCVSFCTVAVTESMASIEKGQLLDLSEADQHFCSSHGANCGGWWHTSAFDQIKSRGVCGETSFPYPSAFPNNNIWSNPPNPACHVAPNRNESVVKISKFTTLTNATDAKNYLSNIGPVAAIFDVYQDFYNYHSGVYQHVSGTIEGSHCVEIVGYSEAGQYWICKKLLGCGLG